MNRQETAAMFGWIRNTYDPRMVMGDVEVIAWQAELVAFTADEAADAIRAHYRESTDRIMLAHITNRIRAKRRHATERRHAEALHRGLPAGNHQQRHQAYLAARAQLNRALTTGDQA